MVDIGLTDQTEESRGTILIELYKTVHGFWDAESNEHVPGIIDEQLSQGRQIKRLSTGQRYIMIGVSATFLAVIGSGHINGTIILEAFKLLSRSFTP
jgi:hypothetical protein